MRIGVVTLNNARLCQNTEHGDYYLLPPYARALRYVEAPDVVRRWVKPWEIAPSFDPAIVGASVEWLRVLEETGYAGVVILRSGEVIMRDWSIESP